MKDWRAGVRASLTFILLLAMVTPLAAATSPIDPPTSNGIADVDVLEDAADHLIDLFAAFDDDIDPDASLSFEVITDTNPGLVVPDVSGGTLTLQFVPDAHGTTSLTVRATDTGGEFTDETFDVTITSVNDEPSFTAGASQVVLEDAAFQNLLGWATNISAGATNEAGQALTFDIANTNTALFSSAPSINASGDLSFQPATDAHGSATLTITLQDDGGTANGGDNESPAAVITIDVTSVNDAPTFTKGSNPVVNEDAGFQSLTNWATNISAGAANESAQVLTFVITDNTNPDLFSGAPTISTAGTLTYTPAGNAFGSATITVQLEDNGGTANGGDNTSAATTFTISVDAVNDAPDFTVGADVLIFEDAGAQSRPGWATNITKGPENESGQTLTFIVSPTNSSLFSALPTIDASGNLNFTPADDAFGTSTVSVTLEDDGGTANGGDNNSATKTFTIDITGVNDPPVSNGIDNVTVNEDAANTVIELFAVFDDAEDADNQLTFSVPTNTNSGLFADVSINAGNGKLTLDYAADEWGSSDITVRATDTDGVSTDETFSVTINSVNDAPSFTSGGGVTVQEDSGLQTINDWATNIEAGPANESSQVLTFVVTADDPALFSEQPEVLTDGRLRFTPADDASGSTNVDVTLTDNGGTDNGGVNASPTSSFTLTIESVNDPPTTTGIDNVEDLEDAAPRVIDLGAAFEDDEDADDALTYTVTNNTNAALFTSTTVNKSAATLTLTYAPDAFGTAILTVEAADTGGESVSTSFSVNLLSVNDAPTFTKGADISVPEDNGPQEVESWATNISAGALNELGQVLSFETTNDNADLFADPPFVASTGKLTFTTAPDAHGTAAVTVTLSDDGGTINGGVDTSAPQVFTILITPSNDPPVANTDIYTVIEGQALIASAGGSPPGLLDNDTDADGDELNVVVIQPPNHSSTWSFNSNGSFVYVHDGSENVNDSLTYVANDGTTSSNIAKAYFDIRPTNDPPTTSGIPSVSVLEDGPNSVISLYDAFDDTDDPDENLVFSVIENSNSALFKEVEINDTGQLVLGYAEDNFGEATLTVKATDPGDLSIQTSFTVTVTGVNDPPNMTVGPDIQIEEDQGAQSFQNWASDIVPGPPNEFTQSVSIAISNDNNTLFSVQPTLALNGTLTFTPTDNEVGIATVTVVLTDNGGVLNGGVDSKEFSFSIAIIGDNDPPTSAGIDDIEVNEDTNALTYNLFNIFDDVEDADESLTFELQGDVDTDIFDSITIEGSPAILTLNFKPDAYGSSSFSVRATDTGGLWSQENVDVEVLAVNDAPSFTKGADLVVEQNSPEQVIDNWATDILAGPENESDQTLDFVVSTADQALFLVQPDITPQGTLTYTPAQGAEVFGEATIDVILTDNGGTENGGVDQSNEQSFTITIRRFNTPPLAAEDNYRVNQGGSIEVTAEEGVLANDSDPENDPLNAVLIDPPALASNFVLNNDGSFTYTHDNSVTTSDVFTYVANDGFDNSDTTSVILDISPSSSQKLSDIVVFEDAEDVFKDLNLEFDPDFDSGEIAYFTLEGNTNPGLFRQVEVDSLSGLLHLSFRPNQNGNATLSIQAVDPTGDSLLAVQDVIVIPVNDAPIAIDDIAATIRNESIVLDVLANDVDPDGDEFEIRSFTNPTTGTLQPRGDDTFLYTPPPGFIGSASFSYVIVDDSSTTGEANVNLTIFDGRFEITDLGEATDVSSAAFGISNIGEVVGAASNASGQVSAFSSERSLITDGPSIAYDVNDLGDIAGASVVSGILQATVWDSLGMTYLGALDGRMSIAYSINNKGRAVGVSTFAETENLKAFFWEDGVIRALTTDEVVESQAFAVNERGQAVGYAGNDAVMWGVSGIPLPLNGPAGRAYALNERGQAVGSQSDGTVKAVFWESNGTKLLIHQNGSPFSEAYGLNNSGWVVGAFEEASASKTGSTTTAKIRLADASKVEFSVDIDAAAKGSGEAGNALMQAGEEDLRAFLWRGGQLIDLNTVIDNQAGWTLLEARAINNAAQIVGFGLINGEKHAFLLSPSSNESPDAQNDNLQLSSLSPIIITPLANDQDADGDSLHIVSVSIALQGHAELLDDGQSISYTPSATFAGSDVFTYTISDGRGGEDEASITIAMDPSGLPQSFRLDQNYPNPFNPATNIVFAVPEEARVTLEVFNLLGQRVALLMDETKAIGSYTVPFEAGHLPGGVYIYRIQANGFKASRKLMLLK